MVSENDAKHKYPYSFKALTTLYHAGKDDRLRVTAALLTGECPEKLHPQSNYEYLLWPLI